MAENIQETGGYFFATLVIVCIMGPVSISLAFIHACRYYKAEILKPEIKEVRTKKKPLPLHKAIGILTNIAVIALCIPPVWGIANLTTELFDTWKYDSCTVTILAIFTMFYYIGKGCMYLIFIMRLHSVYSSSAYGYKPLYLQIAGVIVCITTSTLCALTIGTAHVMPYNFNLFGQTWKHCNGSFPDYYLMAYGVHEICITIITLIAFIRPLKKMLGQFKQASDHGDNSRSRMTTRSSTFKFKLAEIKVTILTLVALLSSFGSLIVGGLANSSNIFFIDMPFTALCIMLMTPYYRDWYPKLCCCCINTCVLCCLCSREQQKMYQQQVRPKPYNIAATKGSSGIPNNSGSSLTAGGGKVTPSSISGELGQVTLTPQEHGDEESAPLELTQKLNNTKLGQIDESVPRTKNEDSDKNEVAELKAENERLKAMLAKYTTRDRTNDDTKSVEIVVSDTATNR